MSGELVLEIIKRLTANHVNLDWYRGKRVLVTGGAGFIGSWLVEALSQLGSTVFVVDNLWRGSINNLERENGSHWISLTEQFFLSDLRDYHAALSACIRSKPDIVFHLADIVAGIDFVFANEPFLFRSNILINSNLFSAVNEAGIPYLVYLGTACSYPRELQELPGGKPLTEDQAYPANPESAYGWSKLLGEYEAQLLHKNTAVQLGVLRLHNVYGPKTILARKRSQVIPSLIRKAVLYPEEDFIVWGSGNQARDFIFIADVLDALLRLPLSGMGAGPIQIASSDETTISRLAELIVEISGKEIEIKYDLSKPEGDGGRTGSTAKAKRILNWEVITPLVEGLRKTYSWAEEQIRRKRVDLDAT